MKNNLNLILITLLLLVTGCGCPDGENRTQSRTSISTATPTTSPTPQVPVSNTVVPLKSSSLKSASVIAENADLHQSPNGKVLQTLPLAASVEVLRQKDAWFYVSYGSTKGWLHGNAIRYDNQETIVPETRTTPKPKSRTSTETDYKPVPVEKTNPSGATARCRDGTLSYSRNRRGTCSHHGGVAVWY